MYAVCLMNDRWHPFIVIPILFMLIYCCIDNAKDFFIYQLATGLVEEALRMPAHFRACRIKRVNCAFILHQVRRSRFPFDIIKQAKR